jgi:hypothetical protein
MRNDETRDRACRGLRSTCYWRRAPRLTLNFACVLALGCGPSQPLASAAAQGWQGSREERGDTLVIRTLSGSVWPGDGRLVEEVAIGTETRGGEDLLGEVYGLDATSDRIYVADRIVPTVRVYDWAGNHLMNIGRGGGGPGEFYSITDLGIDPVRDELVVMESSGVVHRLTLAGEYLSRSAKVTQGAISGSELLLRVTREGVPMVRQLCVRIDRDKNPPMTFGQAFFTLDSAGVPRDTLDIPSVTYDDPWIMRAYSTAANGVDRSFRPVPVPFGPAEVWTISMDGEYITGRPSAYRFEIRHGDGRVTVVEREAEAVPVKDGEKRAGERRVYGLLRDVDPGWKWDGPPIPDTKPYFSAVVPDRSGRLWVLREGEGNPVEGWTEPDDWRGWQAFPAWVSERWFEVFEEETGRYLGRVDVPEDLRVEPEPYIEGNTVVALTEDALGTPIVKRYRVEVPGAGDRSQVPA